MNIEREAKAAIRSEIAPYKHLGARVNFYNEKHDNMRVRFTNGSRQSAFIVHKQAHNTSAISDITKKVRRAMREAGILAFDKPYMPPKPPNPGTFGEKLFDAMEEASEPPCPDAIAAKGRLGRGLASLIDETTEAQPRLPAPERAVRPTPRMEKATMQDVATHASSNGQAKPESAKQRILFTQKQMAEMTRKFDANTTIDEATGARNYVDGWNDEKLRDEVCPGKPVRRVIEYRKEILGPLVSEVRKLKNDPTARLSALEAELARVNTLYSEMDGRLAEAERLLAILAPLAEPLPAAKA